MKSQGAWRVAVEHDGVRLELSLTSRIATLLALPGGERQRGATLKITGIEPTTHDAALASMIDLANAFFFDLDLRYNVALELFRTPTRRVLGPGPLKNAPPRFPANRYPDEAISLYQYGRTARGLPLLSFLAFYQVLEFFFPTFSREEGIRQLRTRLQDPRLDVRDDVALGSLLNSIATVRPGSEREQLRTVLRRCITEEAVSDFIAASEESKAHFCSNKQTVKGAGKISLAAGAADLRDQVADRLYAIRCRIVHTKQDGGESGVELLLPSSREAASLDADVALIQLAAQGAIVAAANPR